MDKPQPSTDVEGSNTNNNMPMLNENRRTRRRQSTEKASIVFEPETNTIVRKDSKTFSEGVGKIGVSTDNNVNIIYKTSYKCIQLFNL